MAHPWYSSIDWRKLEKKELASPYLPTVYIYIYIICYHYFYLYLLFIIYYFYFQSKDNNFDPR